jgi:hypothetical protein
LDRPSSFCPALASFCIYPVHVAGITDMSHCTWHFSPLSPSLSV